MSGNTSNRPNGDNQKLNYRRLGNSGILVSELCLGTMTFSLKGGKGAWGMPSCNEADSHQILDKFVELGGNFIDTANAYGESETVIGNWLKKKGKDFRKQIILATKFTGQIGSGPNDKGMSRKHIFDCIEASLAALQTDYIDLYQVHMFDFNTSIKETLFALNDLIRVGKVRYIGCSNWASWQLCEAAHLAEKHSLESFVSIQQQYSLLCRNLEWDQIDVCKKDGVGILPWSPLAGGWLSGKIKKGTKTAESGSRIDWAENIGWGATNFSDIDSKQQTYKVLEALEQVSQEINQPIAAVALRWLLHKECVSSVIIGARTIQQFDANVKASFFSLTTDQIETLDNASETPLPYPFHMNKQPLMEKKNKKTNQ